MSITYLALTVSLTFLIGTFIGHISHWMLHQKWSGRFYDSHLAHHVKLYPKHDLLSEVYREAGKDSGWIYFTIPIAILGGLLCGLLFWLGVPTWSILIAVLEAIVVGYLHGYIHDSFHIINHPLDKFKWFQDLRRYHFTHHYNVRYNLGIVWFGWDRLLRSFRD